MTLEQEIEELKKKHINLELEAYKLKLEEKFNKLKALEGTVEIWIAKSSKTTRHVSIVHHIKYEMLTDSWKKGELEYNYIGKTIRQITILEAPRTPYKQYKIETDEIKPSSYNGRIDLEERESYSFATYKTISIDDFNTIWNLTKVTTANILDGILDIKDVPWLMTGSTEDYEFKNNEVTDYQKYPLDIPHIFLSQEESWKLSNKFTRIFLHKNIYLLSKNSLLALDDWLTEEYRQDALCYQSCASVGERWRGSRIDEYKELVKKIKNHKN